MAEQKHATGHIDVLDGLRGLAILLVMLFHVWQQSWWNISAGLNWPVDTEFLQRYGYLGVEIFFFLSAFCLYFPFARSYAEQTPPPRWRGYWLKRAFKILPSYWLAIALVLHFTKVDIAPERLSFHLWTHLFFVHSFFFETHYSISGVLWSLAIEVQFYVLFPLVVALFRRSPLLGYLALVTLAALFRAWAFRQNASDGMTYTIRLSQLPAFFDLFGAGMLAAHVLARLRLRTESWQQQALCSVIGVLAFVALLWLIRSAGTSLIAEPSRDAKWQALFRTPLSVILLVFTVSTALAIKPVRWLFATPPLTFLATISYNLYLWHQVLGWQLRKANIIASQVPEPWVNDLDWQRHFSLVLFPLAIGIAALLTYAFEQPILRWGRRFTG